MQPSLREVNNLLQVTQLREKTGFKPRGLESRAQALSLPASCLSADKPVMFSHILYLASAFVVFSSENLRIFEQGQRSCAQQVLSFDMDSGSHAPHQSYRQGLLVSLLLWHFLEPLSWRRVRVQTQRGTRIHGDMPSESPLALKTTVCPRTLHLCTNVHEPWLPISHLRPRDIKRLYHFIC